MVFSRKKKEVKEESVNEQPSFLPIELKPTAFAKSDVQAEMIGARQLPGYPTALGLLSKTMGDRADRLLLDFSAQGVAIRARVDGLWEAMPALDRANGDAALVVIKKLWGMNPNDRRNKQEGKCNATFSNNDWIIECLSQGVPTGERVQLSIHPKKPQLKTLNDLGMREKMQEQLKGLLNSENGLVILSAPAGHGLPTTWRIALESADKYIRDWVSIENKLEADSEMINVTQNLFDPSQGQTAEKTLQQLLLKQPDVFVLPSLYSEDFIETILDNLKGENKHAVTKIQASDPVEAIISILSSYRGQAKGLLGTIQGVLNQRLVRKLCDQCRQAFQPSPQLLQKLGIPAGKIGQLYQPYVPPPPEQRVDAKGNPIEIPICKKCNGRGYHGRVAIFELLVVDQELRTVIAKYAKQPDAIRQFAKQRGHIAFQDESILAVATGLTSLQELARIAQAKT
jgi:type II secretory ATPase GspE/PulE/Tfp pilus assembly ATPase PilB-like protein